MKGFRGLLIAALVLSALVLIAGCSKDNSNPASSSDTDQSVLAAMMTEDADLEGVNSWGGDEDQGGGSPLDSTITPLRWFRTGAWHRDSVTVTIAGDTLATITRYASYNGLIHILVDTTGGIRTFVNKPMSNTLVRKAHGRRIGHNPHPRDNWRIYEVTPEVLLSTNNTVRPDTVKVLVTENGVQTELLAMSDPLSTYFSRDSLPRITAGSTVEVQVIPNVTGPVAAFLHPHVWSGGHMLRRHMEPIGDNTYSVTFVVGPRVGAHLTAVDVLNPATLRDSEAPYDAGSWAVPYRVVP